MLFVPTPAYRLFASLISYRSRRFRDWPCDGSTNRTRLPRTGPGLTTPERRRVRSFVVRCAVCSPQLRLRSRGAARHAPPLLKRPLLPPGWLQLNSLPGSPTLRWRFWAE